jgi:hypothetical protein
MFEKNVLRRIFGPEREETRGDCREICVMKRAAICTIYNEQINENEMAGCVARMREAKNALKIFLVKHEERMKIVRPPSKWVDKWISQRRRLTMLSGFIWLRIQKRGEPFKCSNEMLCSIIFKCLLLKESALCCQKIAVT